MNRCHSAGTWSSDVIASTGHASTHELSLAPMHGSLITYVTAITSLLDKLNSRNSTPHLFLLAGRAKVTAMDLPDSAGSEDVLQQPTRARLFALLAALKGPASTEQ